MTMRAPMPTGAMLWSLEDWLEKLRKERSALKLRVLLVERQMKLTRDRIRHAQASYHSASVSPGMPERPGAQAGASESLHC